MLNIARCGPLLAAIALAAIVAGAQKEDRSEFERDIPDGFPESFVPATNPMSRTKVELGRHLFYDKRLSVNETQSCGSCHQQELAFTHERAQAVGATGEEHPRSSMSLVNVAYAPTLTWAHPALRSLEEQARVPMFGTEPVELGLAGLESAVLDRLRAAEPYPYLFRDAFPADADPLHDRADRRCFGLFPEDDHFGAVAVRSLSFRPRRDCGCGGRQTGRGALLQRRDGRLLPMPRRAKLQWRLAIGRGPRARHRLPQHESLQSGGAVFLPAAQHGPLRAHEQSFGRRQIPGSDLAQHRLDSVLYARWERRNARRGDRPLLRRRTNDHLRPAPRRWERQPQQEPGRRWIRAF